MIGKAEEIIAWLFSQDREKQFEVKEHKEKRSLNANAYAWSLIGKIADAMRMKKEGLAELPVGLAENERKSK